MAPKQRVGVEDLLHSKGLTDFEKIRLMIWGSDEMGIQGLKGKVDANQKTIRRLLAANGIILALIIAHMGLEFSGSGGLLGALVQLLLGA